ncbi:IncP-type conjugal transfer protein TraG [Xanthomonas campestris pv. campestris]|uniref:IncP-type conjugal transfer protein TraG n=1 Tax=Xanthomonas campestris TaxID=339 RepID=UPI001C8646F2|nr:IncP-type conjugal transfer protein TraG [Xanthomonas campestris]MCC5053907.1 IncP-type conjugal transfer protein TraG [Xanthomonas campestris pv. aberrans]MEA9474394.1 IncP-type conjugal transfer protein TraG [Xanthomonas campestris]MEB1128351.1 IncP-type conjugal transfer protein TraG [Xanthomonas campestris pv. campestris]MEB1149465.1 IncP-type conjugal transfer protein TraG [Xanthomonas campestris pv. campestris]MEB1183713.1 IncP-type conjugal transfer protein TraG [Xanthomonas campestr
MAPQSKQREKTRHAGGLRGGPIVACLTCIFLGVWAAGQYVAYALAYQPQLGAPWFQIAGHGIYAPWSYFPWLWDYNAYAPDIFTRAIYIVAASAVLGFVVMVAVAIYRTRAQEEVLTHGSARWAEATEIEKSGLLGQAGVVLGMTEDGQYLTHNGPEHLEVTAPSRSGKGVGIVVPTLLNWQASVVVNDIKGENWELTSGYRSRIGYALKFNPTQRDTCRFNPLAEIRPGDNEVKDAQNVTDMLVDPDGKGKPDHWSKEADSWLLAVVLHVLYAEPDKTLAGIAMFLDNPERTMEATLQYMLDTKHRNGKVHPVVAIGARAMLNKSADERSGVHSTARSFFNLYYDPIVGAATSESDFRITDLMRAKYPLSLYLISPPSDKSRLRPLFRLMLQQITRRLTEELHPEGNKHRLLLLVDEFPSLGKLEFFEEGLGYVAGYGIKCMMINQSYNQIVKYYGPSNTVMDGAHIHVWYAPNTDETAKRISDSLGMTTEIHQQTNYTGGRLSGWLGHVMVSNQESARALMTPGEVREMDPTKKIIVVAGLPPIMAVKIKYYSDAKFRDLVPPTDARGKVLDPKHKYAPVANTAARPYPYGPPVAGNPWTKLTPAVVPVAVAAALQPAVQDSRDLDATPEPTPAPEAAVEAAPMLDDDIGADADIDTHETTVSPAAKADGMDAADDDIDYMLP